ncbi:unnamed protein product [Spodoptera littoralis]|uniref:Uncharacterized protein n=1 Tax=Spodoptera littoralis TaxID=7109 RepID=A0A9P0IDF1_SPOLI|nr:unnamed protein product [Spodoptera littoralis]CAH1644802.1 unnamed protein product [Spodoptera littoralis]
MDIDLVIEKLLVIDYIKLKPEIMHTYTLGHPKVAPLQGFSTIPYVIDFGVVITGSTVQCIADVINYGPIAIKLYFTKGTVFPQWLTIKLVGRLLPGETGKLDVTFAPTSTDFVELENNVETSFNIEVAYGVTIPIQMKALCAVPYLVSNVKAINFGSVRCGDKIIYSVPLKNVGRPTCIWYATLKLKTVGPPPMMVLNNSGNYKPGAGGWLSVAFKPTMEMMYEGHLIFRFHMNPQKMTIPVTGQGIVPHVHIIGPNVNFSPTLPWAETTDIYFGLTNPCPFPIELIMAHSDEKWKEEDDIYQLLYKYYGKPEEMLVPVIKPGVGLPQEVVNFYYKFHERIKRAKEDELALSNKVLTSKVTPAAKKPKSPREKLSQKQHTGPTKDIAISPMKMKIRTEAEIIADEIKAMKDNHVDPLRQCLHVFDNDDDVSGTATGQPEKLSKGILIFFHGSPCEEMQCQEMAYTVGKKLAIPTINVDHCIVHALCETDIPAKELVVAAVEENYEMLKRNIRSDTVTDAEQDEFEDDKDEFEILFDKIQFLANQKNVPTPRSKQSDKKKKKTSINSSSIASHTALGAMGSTTLFQMDLVEELLTELFRQPRYNRGFVVESLTSFVMKNPPLVMMTLIKCKRNIRNLHLVLCQADFSKWAQTYEESQREAEIVVDETQVKVYDETEIEDIVTSFEDMDAEEYENSSLELKSLYILWGLEERRRKYFEKKGIDYRPLGETTRKKDKSKASVHIDATEMKKKAKKDEPKSKTTPRQTPEYSMMNAKYNDYNKLTYEQLINIANNWIIEECDIGQPLLSFNGQVVGAAQKKTKKKSEVQLHNQVKKCECNQLTDLNLLDDTNQDNVLNILSKWHCTCGKKLYSSQTSTSEIPSLSVDKIPPESSEEASEPQPLPLRRVKTIAAPASRLILQPGDLVRCKYSFSPQEEGNYSVKRYVEVSGWPKSRADINVNGICDLPRLDSRPKKMFANFVRRTQEDHIYKITYLDDLKVFEFGPLFIGNNRIYEEDYIINLKNSSLMTADIVIEFLDETTVFNIDKTTMKLEPGGRGKLKISAAPSEVGIHKTVLLFCVNDNPEIVMVNVSCSGVWPIVEILPLSKVIDYGRLLLYRREDDRFIVKNDSVLPIMWKIRNAQEFVEDFIIAQTSGIVPRSDNQVVPVTYIACRVGVITSKILTIDIYDSLGRGDPILMDNLSLSAECYDVMVECAHENPSENYLNYGNVKVNSTVVREMYLLNRGKYNIYYKLKKVKDFPEPSLLRSFDVLPECGVVPATLKLVAIEFECTPTTSMNLVNVPAYICSLLDGSKEQVVVAKFPVCVSIASFYNTFTLFPLGELNFHIIPVGTGITRDVILNNTSKCPVTYEIVLPPTYQMDAVLTAPPPSKGKDTRIRNPPLKCGNFLIMNEDNLLPPGTSRTIQIQFFATAARKFEETISFIISDTCPAEANGVPLRLVGTGAMPTLDLWNLETTFREHLIVKNLSEYKVPESAPHCVFVENSVTLHFFCVTVNSSHTGAIDLYNNGLVACALNMRLHHQSNSNPTIFSLDKFETHIEPLLHKNLGIIFSPKSLQEYRAVLEIRLKLLDNQEQSFKICLIGEGVIPRIELLSPRLRYQRTAVLPFSVTCLGSISSKPISFRNISSVNSVTVLEVLQSLDEVRPIFWLAAAPESELMVTSGVKEEINLRMKVMLRPAQKTTLNAYFNPITKGKTSCEIRITIEENPYEYFMDHVNCVYYGKEK